MDAPLDPLLQALIGKLPAAGSTWPVDKRASWMRLVWEAFQLNYQAGDGESVALPNFLAAASAAPETSRGDAVTQAALPAPLKAPYPFFIDPEGFARRSNGDRVMPGVVNDTMFDQRGEGDLGSIIWADGSRGVRGLVLDISPVF